MDRSTMHRSTRYVRSATRGYACVSRRSAVRTTFSMAEDANLRLKAGMTTIEELLRVLPYDAVVEHRERFGRAG